MKPPKEMGRAGRNPIKKLYSVFGGPSYAPPIVHQSVEILEATVPGNLAGPDEVTAALGQAFENFDDPWELFGGAMVAIRVLAATVEDETELRTRLEKVAEKVLRQIESKLT